MIYKIAKRSARSALGDDFADVWYTFVRSFNGLKAPPRFVGLFSEDLDKARAETGVQFLGHVLSLLKQLKILQGFVSKQADGEEGEIKKALLSLNANLSKAKDHLNLIKTSPLPKGMVQIRTQFGIARGSVELELLDAREKIYFLASLKK